MQAEMNTLPEIDPRFDPLRTLDDISDNRWAKDDKLFIKFHVKPVLHPLKSTQSGRPIYDEVDYITIRTPGSQLSVIESPVVGTKYEHRFAKQYAAWKQNRKEVLSGTPIENAPFLLGKVGMVAELKAMNIQTVEQLANLPDNYTQKIMGGIELRKRALDYIESTSGHDAKLQALEVQNAELMARLAALEDGINNKPRKAKKEEPSPPAEAPSFLE